MERKFRVPVSQVDLQFFKTYRSQLRPASTRVSKPPVPFDQLSPKQKKIVKLVRDHLSKTLWQQKKDPLSLLVLGCAGSGKSALLLWLMKLLSEKSAVDKGFNFKAVAFTGMAAFNVNAETIHSAFHIDPFAKNKSEQMENFVRSARNPQLLEFFKTVNFLLIDEISVCGLTMLGHISKFLQLTHPGYEDVPFGGISTAFFGDIYQLRSIGDFSAWAPLFPSHRLTLGTIQDYYYDIKHCFFLDKSFRQPSESPESASFFGFLNRLRNLHVNDDDVLMLQKRCKSELADSEQAEFENCLHIYPFRNLAARRNHEALHSKFPEESIFVIQNGPFMLELAIGCDVLLKTNLASKSGLCNGSKGKLLQVIFSSSFVEAQGNVDDLRGGQFTAEDIACLLIDFPNYIGSILVETADGKAGIPVYKTMDIVEVNGKREQMLLFKVELAYGSTIHRAQGLTLERVAIWLGDSEHFPGSDYVAMSRVKSWSSIMLLQPLSRARLCEHSVKSRNRLKLCRVEEARVREQEEKLAGLL